MRQGNFESADPSCDKIICFLIDSLGRGGAERVVVTLANEFVAQGRDVHVLILRNENVYALNAEVHLHIMEDKCYVSGTVRRIREIIMGTIWLNRHLRRIFDNGPSITVSHLTSSNLVNILLQYFKNNHHAVSVIHISNEKYLREGFMKRAFLFVQGMLFPFAAHTVAVSKAIARENKARWLFGNERISFIYNPVRVASLPPSLHRKSCKDSLAANLAMVAGFRPEKRHDIALQALREINQRSGNRFTLHLLGTGPESRRICELTKQLGLEKSVINHGWVENPAKIVEGCLLSIVSSDYEGLPNSIVESFALGVQVVATDCRTGPRELLAPEMPIDGSLEFSEGIFVGSLGTLVETGNATALANGILHELSISCAERKMACWRFAEQFSPRLVARRYSALVDSIK